MPKVLESFMIARTADGYVLQMEDEDGTPLELEADVDQLELIAEEIDHHLNSVMDEQEEIEVIDNKDEEIPPD